MQCASFKLQERDKISKKQKTCKSHERPRRFCQQRLVDPRPEDDPRWSDVMHQFQYHLSYKDQNPGVCDNYPVGTIAHHEKGLYLTVQNLKFLGDSHKLKRPTTSFKFKNVTDGKVHRMFVKQVVDNTGLDEDQESQLTCYYDDYDSYTRPDNSKPASARSSTNILNKENKAVQTDNIKHKKKARNEPTIKEVTQNSSMVKGHDKEIKDYTTLSDTQIAFHKSGMRKSLTLSRTQSPESVQVIRVEVVCNNFSSSSITSESEDKNSKDNNLPDIVISKRSEERGIGNCYLANKYLLTNACKPLDENVSGGTKVTLLCKTFRLIDPSFRLSEFEKQSRLVQTRCYFK